MTEVENQTINLLKNIIENRDKIFESINEAKEKLIPIVNIINILGNTYYEVSNSSLLYNILKIKFKYDNKEINFAKDFSEYIIKEKLGNDSVNINSSNISVYSEEHPSIESKRRMDLFIQSDNFEIIIENKIGAGDQPNQLQDYYSNRINENKIIKDNIFVVYLTRYGYKPSEFSIDKKLISDLEKENKIYYLSHDDMANWIEDKILNNKEYEFLKEQKYQSIYSALIQIRDNEKTITNPNEENNMEKEEIKKFFEREDNNYFGLLNNNELKDNFEALDNCHNLLLKAAEVIENKKGDIVLKDNKVLNEIDFSEKVLKYIKENMKDLISNNNELFKFKSNEEIKSNFLQNYKSNENIEMFLIKNPNNPCKSVKISLNQLIYPMEEYKKSLYFGVWIHYYQNKEILDKVKGFIKEKFGNDFEEYNKVGIYYDWVSPYIRYIDIEKDKPEEIGQKIIDLYNLLKEKIN